MHEIPSLYALSKLLPDNMSRLEIDSPNRSTIRTIAHNASDNPEKFKAALESNIDVVELDITRDKKLVAIHDLERLKRLSPLQLEFHDPRTLIRTIQSSGKGVMLDFKDEIDDIDMLHEITQEVDTNPYNIASSNNHILLANLKQQGFAGDIMYSVGSEITFGKFQSEFRGYKFSPNEGVSIRYSLLLKEGVSQRLEDMGLKTYDGNLHGAVWNPIRRVDIEKVLELSPDYITSDNFNLLDTIQA